MRNIKKYSKANPYSKMMKATREHTTETIKKLIKNHKKLLNKDTFIHSDQGVHYTSLKFQKLLKKYKIGQSMYRRENCWANAPQKSFFAHMKDEIDLKSCISFAELEALIDNYRYQWELKKLAPVQYRNQLLVA